MNRTLGCSVAGSKQGAAKPFTDPLLSGLLDEDVFAAQDMKRFLLKLPHNVPSHPALVLPKLNIF